MTIQEYLLMVRMTRQKELLENPSIKIRKLLPGLDIPIITISVRHFGISLELRPQIAEISVS